MACDGEDFPDATVSGALAAVLDELRGYAAVLAIGMDGEGTDLRDPFRINLESAATDHAAIARDRDEEGRDSGKILLHELFWKHSDERTNGGHVVFGGGSHFEADGSRGHRQQDAILPQFAE